MNFDTLNPFAGWRRSTLDDDRRRHRRRLAVVEILAAFALASCATASIEADPHEDGGATSQMFAPLFVEGATMIYAWRIGSAEMGGEPGQAADLVCQVAEVRQWGDILASHLSCEEGDNPTGIEFEGRGLGLGLVATPVGIWFAFATEESEARDAISAKPPFLSSRPMATQVASVDAVGANIETKVFREGRAWCRTDSDDAASAGYPSESTVCFERGRGIVRRYVMGRDGYMQEHLRLK